MFIDFLTEAITNFFKFEQLNTNYKTELRAGVTTFVTMAYILVVNPRILSNAIFLQQPGDLFGELAIATAITSALATALIGISANYPFALAPAMGLNAFFAFSIVLGWQINWRLALTAVLISSLVFIGLIVSKIHLQIIRAIPASLKYATVAGIGLFIAYIALSANPELPTLGAGIIVTSKATITALGSLKKPATLMAVFGLLFTSVLVVRKIKGAMLWGIFATAMLGWILRIAPWPQGIISLPQLPVNIVGQAFIGLNTLKVEQLSHFITATFALLFVTLFDSIGALTGLGQQAGYITTKGELPRSSQSLLVSAIAVAFGALMGTSPSATYLESAAGISEGGRSGFTSIVTAVLFLCATLFTPLFTAIPAFATAPVLILVGVLMMASVKEINWQDSSEAIPAFLVMLTMPLTFSIAEALAIGFVTYPLMKVCQGRAKEVHLAMYFLASLSIFHFLLMSTRS